MREIILKGKVYRNTLQLVDAIAWATNRRGRNIWKHDSNVAMVIYSYLETHNVELPTTYRGHNNHSNIRYALRRLVEDGYGEATTNKRGTYLTFKFKDDVNLNGHTPRFREMEPPPVHQATINPQHPLRSVAESSASFLDIPLPPAPAPERYHTEEVNQALDKWAENDPDSYAEWAETLIERLGALYG